MLAENGSLKKGGGVCMYVKKSIKFSNKSSRDIEIQWASVKKINNRKRLVFAERATFYRVLK